LTSALCSLILAPLGQAWRWPPWIRRDAMKRFALSATLMVGALVMATGWGQAESLSGMITATHTLT
jgi:hypothetical protein